MQSDLFSNNETTLDLPGAHLLYVPECVKNHSYYFSELLEKINWRSDTITIAGKKILVPRLSAWYGDPGANYSYSGINLKPLPWTDSLHSLKQLVEQKTQNRFNSVLLNLYRDGNDSVAWHSDNEPELGRAPTIASVSLGAQRRFSLRGPFNYPGIAQELQTLSLDLEPGSLLIMAGQTQQYWRHQVAKTRREVGARINLTFRYINNS